MLVYAAILAYVRALSICTAISLMPDCISDIWTYKVLLTYRSRSFYDVK